MHVRGVDMLDGTPILDIKPYLSSIPSEKLRRGWLAEAEARHKRLTVAGDVTKVMSVPADRDRRCPEVGYNPSA